MTPHQTSSTGSIGSAASGGVRIGRAAEMLGVSVDTVRRWIDAGKLQADRSEAGQRVVRLGSLADLLAARRRRGDASPATGERSSLASSARNRFPGVVTRIEQDRVAAVVEVQVGPHRFVSLMTAEAVDDLDLKVGDDAVCVVKATNVVVEIPGPRRSQP
ncbi:MAG TPA: TOBE domain-containing protein [Candidatus Limnocylindrales bacterium]|nr:TOBE domain-containing protein [Candidatus Limnocylindrales bacterium]